MTKLLLLLLATSCLAQQYSIQPSHTTESLRGLSTPSQQIAWASGTHGTYLRSLDGGNSWEAKQVPGAESLDFRDVKAFDASVAYLLAAGPGEQSRIYNTTDAGKTWSVQFTNKDPRGFFDCMAFWDRRHGIALGDPIDGHFTLMATQNGGRSWVPVSTRHLPAAINGEGAFAASGSCIAVAGRNNVWFATGGKAARVFRSSDRGKTWQVAATPILSGEDSSGIFSIAFRDAKHGVIGGGDYKQPSKAGTVAVTEDGGATWKLQILAPQSYISGLALGPINTLLAVGSSQAAYAETAQQSSWMKHWDLNLNAVKFNSADTAIAVGPNGMIAKFTGLKKSAAQ